MKTVLVTNQKGGVGKTLIADELCFALERDEILYNYYDLDSQGGALHKTSENVDAVVQIVDTPGAIQNELIDWIKAADMIIVPTKLTMRDQPPLETMIKILKPYKNSKKILIVFNCWNRYKAAKQFIDWFEEAYPGWKTAILAQSEMFNYAAGDQKSVWDYKKDSQASTQIMNIYSIVKYELGIKEGWR